ncbi:MAG: hypothetical protein HUJ73_00900 [Eubacterium sp.]|nr:hypothetical protein [Eubacterium sp.]
MPAKNKIEPNPIAKAIISSTVERSMKEIEEDPRRSIRKLADLGRLFSNGRFTTEVYALVQDLLHNDDSPHYTTIERLLRHTDRTALKTFGINLGYDGLNIGGKIARSLDETCPYRIPWVISLRLNSSLANSLSVTEIENIIMQAKRKGIFCFSIRLEGSLLPLGSLTDVILRHENCAFFLMLPEQKLGAIHQEAIQRCKNVLYLLPASSGISSSNAEFLRKMKIFFGTYYIYDDRTSEEWTSGKKIHESLEAEVPFVVLVADDSCSKKTQKRVTKYCVSTRMHPEHPVFLIDQIGDIMAVDRLRSEKENGCFFEILETGDLRTDTKIITDFRHTVSLEQLLSVACPD